jgi:hypothetical protein
LGVRTIYGPFLISSIREPVQCVRSVRGSDSVRLFVGFSPVRYLSYVSNSYNLHAGPLFPDHGLGMAASLLGDHGVIGSPSCHQCQRLPSERLCPPPALARPSPPDLYLEPSRPCPRSLTIPAQKVAKGYWLVKADLLTWLWMMDKMDQEGRNRPSNGLTIMGGMVAIMGAGQPGPPYLHYRTPVASSPLPSPAPLCTACPWFPAVTPDPDYRLGATASAVAAQK